jgi:hypothetical protein
MVYSCSERRITGRNSFVRMNIFIPTANNYTGMHPELELQRKNVNILIKFKKLMRVED